MVWWTPALGTTDTDGDSERISDTDDLKTYLFVEEGLTGGGGPLLGSMYLFGYRKTWKLVPTGEASAAYQRITIRTDIGCIRHKTIVMGEDEQGRPALYWLSHVGPYRAGVSGVQYIGRDMEDRWVLVNLEATGVVAHGLFVPDRHQVWWFVASGSSQNNPNELWIFDCRLGRVVEINRVTTMRYGWSRADGVATEARCSVLFADTLGASMSRDVKPYVGRVGTGISAPTLWKLDTGTQDVSTNYQAYLITKTFLMGGGQYNLSLRHDALLLAETSSGVTITLTLTRDWGLETTTATALLTAAASETRALLKFEGAQISEAAAVSFQIGDAAAANTSFVLDRLVTPVTRDDRR